MIFSQFTNSIIEQDTNSNDDYWCVGRTTQGTANRHTFNGEIYTVRLYERALSATELKANYDTTMDYHNILLGGGDAETGGNTGGEDLENVKND